LRIKSKLFKYETFVLAKFVNQLFQFTFFPLFLEHLVVKQHPDIVGSERNVVFHHGANLFIDFIYALNRGGSHAFVLPF